MAENDDLMHDGKIVAKRADYKSAIRAKVAEEGVSEDAAWELVRDELLSNFMTRQDSGGKSAKGTKARTSTPSKSSVKAPTDEVRAPKLNGNELDDLSDDALPAELRKNGTSIMDMLASGQIQLDGEDPRAKLLQQAAASGSTEGSEAQKQIELEMPELKYPVGRPTVRIMPADFNRTSLFHVGSNNLPRRFCRNEKLGRVGDGVNIYYQGEELRQTDEAIFRQIIHAARGKNPFEWIELNRSQLIRDAKGTARILSAKDTKEHHEIIMRLRSSVLLIQSKKRGSFITCNLLSEYEGVGDKQRVRIDPRIVLLFDSYAALDENLIYSISGIAQKIYSYLQTIPHTGIHPILIKNLFELCYGRTEYLIQEYMKQLASKPPKEKSEEGMTNRKRAEVAISKKYSDFHRKSLPMALDELKKISLIISYEINRKDDKVAIVKNSETSAQIQEV